MLYEGLLRPILFGMDPEKAHDAVTNLLSLTQSLPLGKALLSLSAGPGASGLETEVLGIRFKNPIGLAAGFDKDCRMTEVLPSLGFGFLELGSITLRPQPGNPKPRIFRVPEVRGLINRLGFNSAGAEAAAERLRALPRRRVPLGINLGLNKDCRPEDAPEAYARTFQALASFGDYFAINVSSPNTAGLRALQHHRTLEKILDAVQSENFAKKPLLVKLDSDISESELPPLLELLGRRVSGVIASNTTVSRDQVPMEIREIRGGLSGAPLRERATKLIARIHSLTGGGLPIIGVGGVFTGRDAYEKIRAGASLIQLYTGLVYGGPATVRRMQRELAGCLKRDGFRSVSEAVGTRESARAASPRSDL